MLGAIIGDIVGSRFEWDGIKTKSFELFSDNCFFTDDTVMTAAVAKAILNCHGNFDYIENQVISTMRYYGNLYPYAGYGGMFRNWLRNPDPKPYNSFGNGAAMRISPVAYACETLEETEELTYFITAVTHNHPEGIRGAEAVAKAVFMARKGYTKSEIEKMIDQKYYRMNFLLDNIRPDYLFDETCQGSVPQAIKAFLESESFEDAIRNAVSLGGDSDTIAAITGGISEAYYGIPQEIKDKALSFLDDEIIEIVEEFYKTYS